jgi:hypothetical protein
VTIWTAVTLLGAKVTVEVEVTTAGCKLRPLHALEIWACAQLEISGGTVRDALLDERTVRLPGTSVVWGAPEMIVEGKVVAPEIQLYVE